MNKQELAEWLKVALLGVIAISGVITAKEVKRVARDGFEMEITMEQADSLVRNASEAKAAAMEDMGYEAE